ncbi:NADH-quinone oxidoreductase subunit NuoK, partial [Pseudomonas sp. NPDC089530]|uniref:NADH-quinone oxidoreductase subunit NuoK n=1 Tax=Pseudomonas sp. NPDC089530 TaxID=3390651 RepID=UPI003CFE48AD
MGTIPLEHGLAVAGILFCLGLVGLMVRRNILFVLMSLEVMMNASALAFIVAGSRWAQPDGQIMFILVISLAAAVGLFQGVEQARLMELALGYAFDGLFHWTGQ